MVQALGICQNLDQAIPPSLGTPGKLDSNVGYIVYILTSCSISALLYIYLLLLNLCKANPRPIVNWFFYLTLVFLQFGSGVVYSVLLKNNMVTFQGAEMVYNFGALSGLGADQVDYFGRFVIMQGRPSCWRKLAMRCAFWVLWCALLVPSSSLLDILFGIRCYSRGSQKASKGMSPPYQTCHLRNDF